MPRTARKQGESSVYHLVNRGEGKQIIFENDADRAFFMEKLAGIHAMPHFTRSRSMA